MTAMYSGVGLLYLLTFYPLINVGYTTNDETHIYYYFSYSLAHLYQEILNSIRLGVSVFYGSTRPNPSILLNFPLFSLVIASYNIPVVMRLLSILLQGANIILFGWLLARIFSSAEAAILGALAAILFIQNSWDHNLLTSYVVHLILFGVGQASFLLFCRYFDSQDKKLLKWSALLYFLSLSYEVNLVYFPIFFVIALSRAAAAPSKSAISREVWSKCKYVAVLVAVYLLVYFYMRYAVNSSVPVDLKPLGLAGSANNAGYNIAIHPGRILGMLEVIAATAMAALPGFRFFYNQQFIIKYSDFPCAPHFNLWCLMRGVKFSWIVRAIAAGGLSYHLLKNIKLKDVRLLGPIAAVGFYLIFAPGIPLSAVEKYQHLIRSGSFGYINTYHSLFGVVVVFIAAVLHINRKIEAGRLRAITHKHFHILASILIMAISIMTDISNNAYTRSQVQSHCKWESVDRFLESS